MIYDSDNNSYPNHILLRTEADVKAPREWSRSPSIHILRSRSLVPWTPAWLAEGRSS